MLLPVSLVLRAGRWRLLLHPLTNLRIYYLFGSLNVAYLINNVLPFQMGDLGRAYVLSELEGISATRSFSTIVVERLLDVLTLLLFLLILIPFIDVPGWATVPSVILASVVLTILVVAIVASLKQDFAMKVADFFIGRAPQRFRAKLNEMARNVLSAFSVLSNPRVALQLVAWSCVIWLTVGLVVFIGMRSFDIDTGFYAALFVLIVTTFGFFVPSSPGSFGVYHAIVIGTLTNVFNIDRNAAVSYALVIHLVFYLPPMFVGLAFLWRERRLWQRTSFLAKLRSLQAQSEQLPG